MAASDPLSRGRVQVELDVRMRRLVETARLLPWVTPDNAAEERRRLVAAARRGASAVPAWRPRARRLDPAAWRWLDTARQLARQSVAPQLYLRRLDELELDLSLIEALGQPRLVRPLVARRFGTGALPVPIDDGEAPLARVARAILETVHDTPEQRTVPAMASGGTSLSATVHAVAAAAGLEVDVRVEPRLAAGAAAGDRTVLLADRRFGPREVVRLAVHEVLGHLVSAANGRAQPLRVLELGTAGSFCDQEGVAITLEEDAGVLDGRRLRTLAGRVVAADLMHEGAAFGEAVRWLMSEHGLDAEDAVGIAERAYRGGGVARDVGYLAGWLRVRHAIREGRATLDELRAGRIGLDEISEVRRLTSAGCARPPVYRPSLALSLRATDWGTSLEMSPPSAATSLTRFEAT